MTTDLLDIGAGLRACVFTLGGASFALDVSSVREVAEFEDVTPVPRAPAAVVGVANLRGEVMPIVDARSRLGLPLRSPAPPLRTLVMRAADFEVALVIDAVMALETFTAVAPPPDGAAGWVQGAVEHAGRRVTLLDAAHLLRALQGEG